MSILIKKQLNLMVPLNKKSKKLVADLKQRPKERDWLYEQIILSKGETNLSINPFNGIKIKVG